MKHILPALLLFLPLPAHAREVTGYATVTDGDTIEVNRERLRLEAIDAPEIRQTCHQETHEWPCGVHATMALSNMLYLSPVRCVISGRDKYGRSLETCFKGAVDVNKWMVRNGWALAYRRYSAAYIADEEKARREKKGIWGSSFVEPWDYRKK